MSCRIAVRAFNRYRTYCSPSVCSRRWYSAKRSNVRRSSDTEHLKSSVTVNGETIKYIRSGEGQHTILCLPGALGSSITDFYSQINGLDEKAFTVVAWDPPGYGHSRPPNRDFSPGFLERDADYAVDFMKAIDIPKFSVLGWCDGGITGIFLAAKYPENLKKMIIWGSHARISEEEASQYTRAREDNIWPVRKKGPMVSLYGKDDFRTMWGQWVDEFVRIAREDAGDICVAALKDIQCPLFVIHGGKDPVVHSDHPKYIIENVPGSKLHIFDRGKHDFHMQFPEMFNSLVQDFLKQDEISNTADQNNGLPVRLPPFCSNNPTLWFAQVEAQFHLSHINDNFTKFNYVVSVLDTSHATVVEDVVCNPPEDGKYEKLKTELIERLKEDRVKKALSNAVIGNKKPSEFLNHLRKLAGNSASEPLLRSFWLAGLSSQVQSVLATQSSPLDSLAQLADKLADIQSERVDLSSIEQRRITPSSHLMTPASPKEPSQEFVKPATGPKSRIESVPTRTNLIGYPLEVSLKNKKLSLERLQELSSYHSLLAEFPNIVYPPEVPQKVHFNTRHRILTKSGYSMDIPTVDLNPDKTRVVRYIVDSMIRQGTLRPSNSPYGSALRVLRTSYGFAERISYPYMAWCDYRLLNRNTISDPYRIHHPVDISNSLWGCSIFSVVKLLPGWTPIPLEPEDIAKTAVVTPFGKFEFPFKPLSLLNSRTTWQKVLDEVLEGLPYCLGYQGEILVFSRYHKEHLQHIHALFQRLSMYGIGVKVFRSDFGKPSVDFAYYTISGSGCSPIPENFTKAIENIRSPNTYSELAMFLDMIKVYKRFIPASIEGPLRAAVEGFDIDSNVPVPWTFELEETFKKCKSALTRATLDTRPDPLAPLSISVSVVDGAIGAVVNQTTRNHVAPLAFFSIVTKRQSSSNDENYVYGVYHSLKKFLPVIGGRHVTMFTDFDIGSRNLRSSYLCSLMNYCLQHTSDIHLASPSDAVVARCLASLIDRQKLST